MRSIEIPADRAREPAQRLPPISAPSGRDRDRRIDRLPLRRQRRWSESNPRLASSAAPASCRSRTRRTPPARWPAPSPMRRCCWARYRRRIRQIERRPRRAESQRAITRHPKSRWAKGARIGIARKRYFGYSPATDALIDSAIAQMKAQGAMIIDPADIATAARLDDCEFEILALRVQGRPEHVSRLAWDHLSRSIR